MRKENIGASVENYKLSVMRLEANMTMGKKYQFVNWFPEWRGFYCFRWHKAKSVAYIYDWFFGLGFWEIRKWHKLKEGELPKS